MLRHDVGLLIAKMTQLAEKPDHALKALYGLVENGRKTQMRIQSDPHLPWNSEDPELRPSQFGCPSLLATYMSSQELQNPMITGHSQE